MTVVALSGIGVAVRQGAPKPDISSREASKVLVNFLRTPAAAVIKAQGMEPAVP